MTGILKAIAATAVFVLSTGPVAAQSAQDGFDPAANGIVRVIEQQRDGRLLMGGSFMTIDGVARSRIVRFNNDGSAESAFDPAVTGGGGTGSVWAVHEQPGGRILIGGRFDDVDGEPHANLARVNANGSLDAAFNPQVDGRVLDFHTTLSPDGLNGLIYIAGDFDTVQGAARNGVARLNANGTLSAAFDPPDFNGYVRVLATAAGSGYLLVAGGFSTLDGGPVGAPIVRLSLTDGSRDLTFSVNTSSANPFGNVINEVVVLEDGRILIAGDFDTVSGQPRTMIARLHPNGSLDSTFVPPTLDAAVTSMTLQSDGRIVIAGDFDNHVAHQKVARLHADGSWDASFNTIVVGSVHAMAMQYDGNFAIGGQITALGAYSRQNIARLLPDGSPDTDFIADLSAGGGDQRVNAVAVQADGRVLVGGRVDTPGPRIKRLLPNGLVDTSFNRNFDAPVEAIAVQADGRILVGSELSNLGSRIVRLNRDGSVDNGFSAATDELVRTIAVQADGRILIGGHFSAVNGLPINRLARLMPNGDIATLVAGPFNGNVIGLALQADGKILVGGVFTQVGGDDYPGLVRLDVAFGAIDPGFDPPDIDGPVRTIAVQTDGRILIGGDFDNVGGQPRRGIARLLASGAHDTSFVPPAFVTSMGVYGIVVLNDDRIAIGGHYVNGADQNVAMVRLLSSGGADTGLLAPVFVPGSLVFGLAMQADGKLLAAGDFASVDGVPRDNVVRLAMPGFVRQGVGLTDIDGFTWAREGAASALLIPPRVSIATECCDETDFVLLEDGLMQPAPGNPAVWTFPGVDIPGSGTVWLRATGLTGDGSRTGSSLHSPIMRLELSSEDDTIFANGFEDHEVP